MKTILMCAITALLFASFAKAQVGAGGGNGSGGTGAAPLVPYMGTGTGYSVLSDSLNYIDSPIICSTVPNITTPQSNKPAPICTQGTNGTTILEADQTVNPDYENSTFTMYLKSVTAGTDTELAFNCGAQGNGGDPVVCYATACDATDKLLFAMGYSFGNTSTQYQFDFRIFQIDSTALCTGPYAESWFDDSGGNILAPIGGYSNEVLGFQGAQAHVRIIYKSGTRETDLQYAQDGDRWRTFTSVCPSGCNYSYTTSPFSAEGYFFGDGNSASDAHIHSDAWLEILSEKFQ